MHKTLAYCIIAPALGAVAVSITLLTAMYVGQGLWELINRSILW